MKKITKDSFMGAKLKQPLKGNLRITFPKYMDDNPNHGIALEISFENSDLILSSYLHYLSLKDSLLITDIAIGD